MRLLLILIVIVLLILIVIVRFVGIAVVLSPTIRSNWNVAPASDLAESMGQESPYALAWRARLVRGIDAS